MRGRWFLAAGGAAAIVLGLSMAGCGARDRSAEAEAAALEAERAAARAEAQALKAEEAAKAASAAADHAVKSVQDATREINAVADRLERLRQERQAGKPRARARRGGARRTAHPSPSPAASPAKPGGATGEGAPPR